MEIPVKLAHWAWRAAAPSVGRDWSVFGTGVRGAVEDSVNGVIEVEASSRDGENLRFLSMGCWLVYCLAYLARVVRNHGGVSFPLWKRVLLSLPFYLPLNQIVRVAQQKFFADDLVIGFRDMFDYYPLPVVGRLGVWQYSMLMSLIVLNQKLDKDIRQIVMTNVILEQWPESFASMIRWIPLWPDNALSIAVASSFFYGLLFYLVIEPLVPLLLVGKRPNVGSASKTSETQLQSGKGGQSLRQQNNLQQSMQKRLAQEALKRLSSAPSRLFWFVAMSVMFLTLFPAVLPVWALHVLSNGGILMIAKKAVGLFETIFSMRSAFGSSSEKRWVPPVWRNIDAFCQNWEDLVNAFVGQDTSAFFLSFWLLQLLPGVMNTLGQRSEMLLNEETRAWTSEDFLALVDFVLVRPGVRAFFVGRYLVEMLAREYFNLCVFPLKFILSILPSSFTVLTFVPPVAIGALILWGLWLVLKPRKGVKSVNVKYQLSPAKNESEDSWRSRVNERMQFESVSVPSERPSIAANMTGWLYDFAFGGGVIELAQRGYDVLLSQWPKIRLAGVMYLMNNIRPESVTFIALQVLHAFDRTVLTASIPFTYLAQNVCPSFANFLSAAFIPATLRYLFLWMFGPGASMYFSVLSNVIRNVPVKRIMDVIKVARRYFGAGSFGSICGI